MIELQGLVFGNLERIPCRHTTRGAGVSPGLVWRGLPEGTQELAVVCDSWAGLSTRRFFHWIVYKISVGVDGLDRGDIGDALTGRNSRGVCDFDPPDPARCRGLEFALYALDTHLEVQPGLNARELFEAIDDRVLDVGTLVGLVDTREPAQTPGPVHRRSEDIPLFSGHRGV